jgi:hypothetical protein
MSMSDEKKRMVLTGKLVESGCSGCLVPCSFRVVDALVVRLDFLLRLRRIRGVRIGGRTVAAASEEKPGQEGDDE